MITSGADIYMRVGGGGVAVYVRLLLLVGSDDGRLLTHLKMGDATPLGRWRGFKLHDGGRRIFFFVTPLRQSANHTIASTTACDGLFWLWHRHDDRRSEKVIQ